MFRTGKYNRISIHAPSRERHHVICVAVSACNFNPRSLAGATLPFLIFPALQTFQSTLPRGSDRLLRSPYSPQHKFQSTLPRGSDLSISHTDKLTALFQSTLPRGSDNIVTMPMPKQILISIHAPSRERPRISFALSSVIELAMRTGKIAGATADFFRAFKASEFQSTLPRGSDDIGA